MTQKAKQLKAGDPSQREIWTAKDVADFFLVDERTVTAQATKGTLPGFKVGNLWRFKREKITALV